MKNPLVSVIVTTKNEEKNIERLLKSIKNQTYNNIETIVVDNPKTTDKTREIAKKFTNNLYLKGSERSIQRNYGAQKSKGDYLIFLDADMEVTTNVVKSCVELAKKTGVKLITIPETTVGDGIIATIRKFEREMYMGDIDYEVPRFFERRAFFEFKGYDPNLTGPEDYDLPYRMRNKYKSERINEYIYHHENNSSLLNLLKKKFYYASKGASYAEKHPKLIWVQGTILFRSIYLKNWKKFLKHPLIGLTFLVIRFLEMIWAFVGFVSTVGINNLFKIMLKSIR